MKDVVSWLASERAILGGDDGDGGSWVGAEFAVAAVNDDRHESPELFVLKKICSKADFRRDPHSTGNDSSLFD